MGVAFPLFKAARCFSSSASDSRPGVTMSAPPSPGQGLRSIDSGVRRGLRLGCHTWERNHRHTVGRTVKGAKKACSDPHGQNPAENVPGGHELPVLPAWFLHPTAKETNEKQQFFVGKPVTAEFPSDFSCR